MTSSIVKIKKLIQLGEIEQAFKICERLFKRYDKENEYIQLSAQWKSLQKLEISKTISNDEVMIRWNQITKSLLALLDMLTQYADYDLLSDNLDISEEKKELDTHSLMILELLGSIRLKYDLLYLP